jgi:cytochrome b6-f complex iron-sulfur subunit
MTRAANRYIESLLRGRRPRPFAPSQDDLALTRTAITLAAAHPGARQPDPAFVDSLRHKIAAQASAEQAPSSAPPAQSPLPRPARAVPARRRVLQTTVMAAIAAAVGAAAGHLLIGRPAGTQSATPPAGGALSPTLGAWQTVADAAELPEGAVMEFDLGSVVGFLQRSSGRLQAVSGICTHQGCRLNLATPPDQLICPCHGATFSVSGQPLAYPHHAITLTALPRLPVRVYNGAVQIYAPPQSTTPPLAS